MSSTVDKSKSNLTWLSISQLCFDPNLAHFCATQVVYTSIDTLPRTFVIVFASILGCGVMSSNLDNSIFKSGSSQI